MKTVKAKIRKINKDGHVRLETSGEIKEVLVHENILSPDREHIDICFRGKDSSGIIQLTTKEFDSIVADTKRRTHLIKGMKVFRE